MTLQNMPSVKEELTSKEVISGNEILAKFMGFIYHELADIDYSECGGIYTRQDVYSKVEIPMIKFVEQDQFYIQDEKWNPAIGDVIYGELKYHTSFDWLMPVWYKFRDLKLKDFNQRLRHQRFRLLIGNKILQEDSPEPAFQELVKAIEWF